MSTELSTASVDKGEAQLSRAPGQERPGRGSATDGYWGPFAAKITHLHPKLNVSGVQATRGP